MILLARGKRVPYSIFKHASSVCGTFILQIRVRTADAPTDAFQDSSKVRGQSLTSQWQTTFDSSPFALPWKLDWCLLAMLNLMSCLYMKIRIYRCCVWRSGARILLLLGKCKSKNQRLETNFQLLRYHHYIIWHEWELSLGDFKECSSGNALLPSLLRSPFLGAPWLFHFF